MNIKASRNKLMGFLAGALSLCNFLHAAPAVWQMPPFELPSATATTFTSSADDNGHIFVLVQKVFPGDLLAYYYTNGAWELSDTLTTGISSDTAIAMEPSGTALALFTKNNITTDIFSKYFDGSTWSIPNPNPFASIPLGNNTGVKVSMNGPNSGLAMWRDASDNTNASFFLNGNWSTPVIVATTPPIGFFANQDVAYSANGSAVGVWSFGNANIVNYDGTSWQPVQSATGDSFLLLGGIDNSGNALLYAQDGNNVYVRFFNAVTSVLSAPQTISTGTGNTFSNIKMAPNGTAVAVWVDGGGVGTFSTYNGSTWTPPQPLPFAIGSFNYSLALDAAGNAIIVYLAGPGNTGDILASRLPVGGSVWGAAELVSPATSTGNENITGAGLSLNGIGFGVWGGDGNFANASLLIPTPPLGITGFACTANFASQSDTINEITWAPSTDPTTVAYIVRQNGVIIATVPATAPTTLVLHNLCKGRVYVYEVTAVNGLGIESDPIFITL